MLPIAYEGTAEFDALCARLEQREGRRTPPFLRKQLAAYLASLPRGVARRRSGNQEGNEAPGCAFDRVMLTRGHESPNVG